MNRLIIILAALTMTMQSCVTARKYEEMQARRESAEQELANVKGQNEACQSKLKETQTELDLTKTKNEELISDTAQMGKDYRYLRTQYDKVNELNDILMNKNTLMLNSAKEENQKLLTDLNMTQEQLQQKEDRLKILEKDLNDKEAAVKQSQEELKAREVRLKELEDMLSQQQAASDALKKKVQSALLGFEGKGLSVTQKNGKVYVSMEAKLLFASGSTKVEAEGMRALKDLAKAIEGDTDMEIIVEGHTDTDKISSSSIPRDNWELSVLRATEVVKIITANSTVSPKLLSASGRSEYHPVDPSDKAKNRRIEIILQPKLDELYNILEQ
jgi:chemotaxis protein MotB